MELMVISIVVLVAALISINLFYKSKNIDRHRNSESLYAHFSKIDRFNYILFPKLLFTNPIYITLHAGQCLFIPRKWWHWVKTPGKSFAVNFWFDNDNHVNPFLFDFKQQIKIKNITETVSVWNSEKNIHEKTVPFEEFYTSGDDNLYIITLESYDLGYNNKNLKNSLNKLITFPTSEIKTPKVFDYNIWASSGKHDTGLHYDDEDGILSLVEGKKEIILFPPSDTPYLYKLEVKYPWLNNTAIDFHYNTYKFIKVISGISSSQILYETCKHDLKVLSNITKLYQIYKKVSDYIVWSFKLDNEMNCSWELYRYTLNDKLAIISGIIQPEKYDILPETHLYYNKNDFPGLPFWAYGNSICPSTTGVLFDKNKYLVLDTYDSFNLNYNTYMVELGYADIMESIKDLVFKYTCYEIGIRNNNDDYIYIQYLGISKDDFLKFLFDFNYGILDFVKNSDYHLNNEVMVVYHPPTRSVTTTEIYGII